MSKTENHKYYLDECFHRFWLPRPLQQDSKIVHKSVKNLSTKHGHKELCENMLSDVAQRNDDRLSLIADDRSAHPPSSRAAPRLPTRPQSHQNQRALAAPQEKRASPRALQARRPPSEDGSPAKWSAKFVGLPNYKN